MEDYITDIEGDTISVHTVEMPSGLVCITITMFDDDGNLEDDACVMISKSSVVRLIGILRKTLV